MIDSKWKLGVTAGAMACFVPVVAWIAHIEGGAGPLTALALLLVSSGIMAVWVT